MKFARRDNRSALSARRVILALVTGGLIPILLYAGAPSWWSERGVLVPELAADDYAPINQGQLKNLAKAAAAEMESQLSGGAGSELRTLIESWSIPSAETNDYAPVNLGQLKKMVRPFYDRLIAAGLIDVYPWLRSPEAPDDFSMANIGQAKHLFAFEIPKCNSVTDPSQDRLATGLRSGNLVLKENAVWFWANRFVADSSFQNTYPRRLTAFAGIKSVSAGDDHRVALTNDGTVLTWGKNGSGQLGEGTHADRETAREVPNLAGITSAKASGAHTFALQQDGTVLAWGENYYGQLGCGNHVSSATPVPVVGLSSVRKIAAGPQRGAALKADGTVWTWGYDHYDWQTGQDIFSHTPAQVAGLADVIDVTLGYEHSVAVKADGTVWVWGSNYSNQLGNGSPSWFFQAAPVQVPNLANVIRVVSGFDHTLALLGDGTVWSWGANNRGQLGDGTSQTRSGPAPVVGLTGAIAIATNYTYSLAMKADGTVWTWGEGSSGTLPNVDLQVPQQVGLGIFDTNQNGMDDRWEAAFFGDKPQAPEADLDGDGISNYLEYLRGADPRDYFNGMTPVLEMVSGNNQLGDAATFLSKPLTVRVKSASGQTLVNAPVDFRISSGSAFVAGEPGGSLTEQVARRTDAAGQARAYVRLPAAAGTSARIVAAPALPGSSIPAGAVTFRVSSRYALPATPTPSPDPNPGATPSPTPSATPSPSIPYRYAVIDLGKDMYPIRINNNGWILMEGPDAQGTWGYYRWKGGVLERLANFDPYTDVRAIDMNDDGTVVGRAGDEEDDRFSWVDGAANEFQVALKWPANATVPIKVSGVAQPHWSDFYSGTMRLTRFSAIANRSSGSHEADVYGAMFTGGGYGWLSAFAVGKIMNAQRWSGGSAPVPLSFATSTKLRPPGYAFSVFDWKGPIDFVLRANSARSYIGRRRTPAPAPGQYFGGIESGMIDGQTADFDPVDLNEAGVIVGTAGADLVITAPPSSRVIINGASPIAINDHTRPAPSPSSEPSPASSPAPTPIPAPQILGRSGEAFVLWERQEDGLTWHPFGLEEMIPAMDGWEYLTPQDMNDSGTIAGYGWYTDPSNPQAEGEGHAFLLVPVELMVDANRDGSIDNKDRGKVSEQEPWHFWYNEDNDSGETGGDDIPLGSGQGDFGGGAVSGIRDLVDFFSLFLDLKELVKVMPPESNIYKLKAEGGAFKFVYTDLTPADSGKYLRELAAAEALKAADKTLVGAGSSAALDPAFLNTIKDKGEGVLLIEAGSKTDKPLVLEIYKGGEKLTELKLYVKTDSVEKMFRHKNLLAANGQSGGRRDELDEPPNYPDRLSSDKKFVFVHGYNVNPEQARGWNCEMFKRLFWSGSKAKFYGITWYGSETQVTPPIVGSISSNYQANVDNAFATAQSMSEFTSGLGGNVTVAAHSLGNIVVGSAMHDWQATGISNYFMVNAAVAKEAYDPAEEQLATQTTWGMDHPDWSSYPRRLWCSDWHKLFQVNDNRSSLTWQNRLERVANVYNFYSTGEEVLANPSSAPTIPTGPNEVWNNQERLKGLMESGQVLSSNYGGWRFTNYHNEGQVYYPQIPPAQTTSISDAQLREHPFFWPGPAGLFGANGSNYASPQQHRNTLLAEMVPTLSFAAGSNPVTRFGLNNINMQSDLKNGWPAERGQSESWFHSDARGVAYLFTHEVFDRFVEFGDL